MRLAVLARLSAAVLVCAVLPAPAGSADPPKLLLKPLLDCLEPIARTFHVRIVDTTGLAPSIACVPPVQQSTLDQALDQLVKRNGLYWRRLDDGTVEIGAANPPAMMKLSALSIEGEPVMDPPRPDNPVATPLIERAMAFTAIDQRWLDSAPLLGFNQISWYAPNVYGAGQSLAIRGMERDSDYFPALTVTFDGIDLGTRLLDDELVPLDDVVKLNLARGPRTFEAGDASQAGAISLATAAPAAEQVTSATLGVGNLGARNAAISWSGPLGASGLGATFALDVHRLPGFVRQLGVPEANVEERRNDFGRFKLSYTPDSPTGLSAGLAGLALSGDSSDRVILPAVSDHGQPQPASFDPSDRNSYASDPVVARTRARGAAGFVRYEEPERWAIDAHASVTTIYRGATALPQHTQWTDEEIRRRLGLTASGNPASDWTVVAGLEHGDFATSFFTPFISGPPGLNHLTTETDSASLWIEHSWGSSWNAGLGARWVREQMAGYPGQNAFTYDLPIPLAVLEWRPWTDHAFLLSYGTGYRSGGLVNADAAYLPERSRNIEFAWRAQWLGGSLHTALSAFDNQIHDRFTYRVGSDPGNSAPGRVRDRGLELELTAELSDHWRLRAGIGALKSRYSSFDYRYGDPTSEAPPQTVTFGVRYGRPQGWYGALDAYRAAAAEYDTSRQPVGHVPPYDVLGLRVGHRTANRDIALIAANALDAQYVERFQFTAGRKGYRIGDPRRIELRAKWNW
jgi:hypothetical protein